MDYSDKSLADSDKSLADNNILYHSVGGGSVEKIVLDKLISNDDIVKKEGTWFNSKNMKHGVINRNCDVYYKDEDGMEKLLCKLRKNVIPKELIELGWNSFKDLAKASRGRWSSAGPIDPKSAYWKKRKLVDTDKWKTSYLVNGKKSKMKVNNQVASTPIGFYEASNNMVKLPCRLTHFTRTHYDDYMEGLPFIKKINELFKGLVPDRYAAQLKQANARKKLKINDTAFSTITINRNFRTALHRDAGDLKAGFGNLTCIQRGKYHGGETMFPQFGVAIDLRTGDFLAMDVHEWHCNAELYETAEDKAYNKKLPKVFKDNPEVGTAGLDKDYTRLSFVCYLREKIITCPKKIDKRYLGKSGSKKIQHKDYSKTHSNTKNSDTKSSSKSKGKRHIKKKSGHSRRRHTINNTNNVKSRHKKTMKQKRKSK